MLFNADDLRFHSYTTLIKDLGGAFLLILLHADVAREGLNLQR